MTTPLLTHVLEPIVRRHRLQRTLMATAVGLFFLGGAVLVLRVVNNGWQFSTLGVVLVALVVWFGARRWAAAWQPDYRGIARRIEAREPSLHALLATAVEQTPDAESGKLNYLQQRVVAEAAAQARRQNWLAAVPAWRLAGLSVVAFAAFIGALLPTFGKTRAVTKAPPLVVESREGVEVTPGDASLERGSGLVVLAKFHSEVPGAATLVIHPKNEPEQRMPLVKNLDDPVFGGGLPEVQGDLTYRIEYAGTATRDFAVKVFEHPRLDRADATLHFPEYTKLADKTVPETRRVSAVEGSKVDVAFQLNKPVKSAALVAKDGTRISLAVTGDKPLVELRDFPVKASATFELKLEDEDGRVNKVPAQFVVEALPNRRPELKFQTPKGDQRVSPIEEVAFRAQAWDDFGLVRYGLTVTVAGRPAQDHELGRESRADEKRDLTHLLKLEELAVQTDELVSWFLWADDTGTDGQPRRTSSDMFFAEVRPFEEIYRPGDAAGGGGGGGGGGEEETKLAEMQKQIISATWNLQRAEQSSPGKDGPSEKYRQDAPVILESQAKALEQAKALAEKADDPKAKALVEAATQAMQIAHDHLSKAAETAAPLPDALAAEQAAYSALLKLAAHEFRVTRNQQAKGGGGGGKQQQQLDELEMKDEEKRYEDKSAAEPPAAAEQREQLAILNRLKELAQRQNDINEQLKELQTALQEAKTEPEKEEVRRQLERLREEEQQMLADVDETRQKMEQSSQQAELADQRAQLDKTRAEAQKAAEAMQQGAPSQALASGTRAAKDLEAMRDEFRKKTSGQFKEEMREMRTDAREIAERQEQIGEQLQAKAGQAERPTLDGSGEREKLTEQLTKQQGDLGKLTEQMQRVSEQAEAAEPLLAKELYDTLRKTAQAGTGDSLDKTQQLAERGYAKEARKFEEKARQEIEELKTGVERAAGSVLGDEAEALRQARAELDTLAQQLNRELAQARPDLAQQQSPRSAEENAEAGAPGNTSVPPAGEGVPPSRTSGDAATSERAANDVTSPEVRPGETPGPARETRALPGEGHPGEQPPEGQGTPGNSGQGQAPENAQGQGQKPSQGEGQGQAQTPGQGSGQGQGQNPDQGMQGQGQGGQTAQGAGAGGGGQASPTEANVNPTRQPGQQPGLSTSLRGQRGIRSGSDRGGLGSGANEGEQAGPLTGDTFTEWSDRLRNVEEMVDSPDLRTEVARIRETAKGVRAEFKRHSVKPNWDLVNTKISTPLAELRNRLTEELARRESKESLVPIDRDPVPTKYAERVRRYYEELGRSGDK